MVILQHSNRALRLHYCKFREGITAAAWSESIYRFPSPYSGLLSLCNGRSIDILYKAAGPKHHEATIVLSTIPSTLSSSVSPFNFLAPVLRSFLCVSLTTIFPLPEGFFPVLRSTLASYFSFHVACLSTALNTGGLSSIAGPQGATISVTTCLICRLNWRPSSSIPTTSPKRIEEFGSETR